MKKLENLLSKAIANLEEIKNELNKPEPKEWPKSVDELDFSNCDRTPILGHWEYDGKKFTPSKKTNYSKPEYSKAVDVMPTLIKARDTIRDGWEPDSDDNGVYNNVILKYDSLVIDLSESKFNEIFSFQSFEAAKHFLKYFKYELEIFKGLYL